MSQHKFVNRIEDMKILEDAYSAGGPSLFVLYGRRRVGKTELISNFVGDRGVYFLENRWYGPVGLNEIRELIYG